LSAERANVIADASTLSVLPLTLGFATAATTYIGGRFPLRWRHKIEWLLGFGAGAVLGVALFDILPEARELSTRSNQMGPMIGCIALGFMLCLALYRLMPAHTHSRPGEPGALETVPHTPNTNVRNLIGAGSLSLHSLLDGIGIGLALKASTSVGIIVAVGVLVHDFSDGINTVSIVLRNHGTNHQARGWLVADSVAPLLGIICASLVTTSRAALGALLFVFCGVFVYIGGFDLLPEALRRTKPAPALALTTLGASIVYAAVTLAKR
jgi:ZIP family zinc transporter